MRKLIPILFLLLIIAATMGCGVTEEIGQNCGGDLKELCHNIFGGRTDNRQNNQIDDLKKQINSLEIQNATVFSQIAINQTQISGLNSQVSTLQSQVTLINSILPTLASQSSITLLQTQLTQTNLDISSLTSRVTVLEGQIGTPVTGLQAIVTQNIIQIAQLMSNHNVTKIVDPCGDGPGYDEIFLRTSSGKLIASFSQNSSGLNTRFSELVPGSYATTDGTGCTFTVNPDLSVTPSVEY